MRICSDDLAREEFANFLTHCGGLLLAVLGAAILFHDVAEHANDALRLSCWIYALALVAVYAVSALSHLFANPGRRQFFRSLDQGVIFLFIAANFTPYAIACLRNERLWILLAIMWAVALVGFSSKIFWRHRVESTTVIHYLALGWLPVTAVKPFLQTLPSDGVFLSVAGGLFYTLGTVFLTFDEKVRYFHALWHLFVIAGSCCHFLVVVDYIIPLEESSAV